MNAFIAQKLKENLLAELIPHGQEHLLAFWDQLNEAQQRSLADQIRNLDLPLVGRLFRQTQSAENWAQLASQASAPRALRWEGARSNPFPPEAARERGAQALSAGELGVILVAGGQGTRLGFDHPKGMYAIGPVSQSTLFQILFEKILARSRQFGVRIPLYLMTSPATHEETGSYLQSRNYFGLDRDDVKIFCQGTMPAVDADSGKVLLADEANLFLSPDGHGGMLAALDSSGGLADVRQRGIRQLFYLQVDNPIVSMCDPETIGYHLMAEAEVTTQVMKKRAARDKVGNVVEIDGRMRIIEYSDLNPLPDDIVERRSADGSPVFWAGNLAVHVFAAEFLERTAASAGGLPFHVARKAVPYLDPISRRPVEPTQPNAVKFERFIFDLLPEAQGGIVVEVDERRMFAPIKNAPGASQDSPETVRDQMVALHREWLIQAGCEVSAGVAVEISPLFAQDASETADRVRPGLKVTQPRYFC